MKIQFGCLILGLSLMFQAPAIAQSSQNQNEEALRASLKKDVVEMERQYAAGAMTAEPDIIGYVQVLTLLKQDKTAFEVLSKAFDQKQVTRSVDNVLLAAYALRFQDKYVDAIPYLKEAVALGHPTAQIQLTEGYIDQYQTGQARDCKFLETEIAKAVDVGMPAGKAMMYNGHCYTETAKVKMAPDCKSGLRASQYSKMSKETRADIKTAKSFFKQVPKNAPQYRDAQNWLFVIKSQPTIKQYLCGEIGGDPK